MPIYEFRCSSCGKEFEEFVRTFTERIKCPFCGGDAEKKLYFSPVIRMGALQDDEVKYYEDKKDFLSAAKAAEKEGKSEWEIKDYYRKAGKEVD